MTTAIHPIPNRINLVLCLALPVVCAGALHQASHATTGWQLALWAVLFGYANNTVFSLLHEAVHGILFSHRRWNDGMGSWLACWFPTAFGMQRAFHLAHHRHNRTDGEFFDGFYPGDHLLLKRLQWYGIITGVYWLHNPLACLLWLGCPWLLRRPGLRDATRQQVRQHGAAHMLAALERLDPWRSRAEVLLMVLVQAALWWSLDLTLIGWAACYGAFAVLWGSLQYADHAFSPRSIRDGAWNLRVSLPARWIFLNYHHHLAHHQHPTLPWLHLGRMIDPAVPRPSFWRIYLRMWLGPQPARQPPPERDAELERAVDAPFRPPGDDAR